MVQYSFRQQIIPGCLILRDGLDIERLATPHCVAQHDNELMSEEGWNKRTGKRVGKNRDTLFELTVLPYLNSAHNLARWLTRNEHDAEDVVQEAFLRAFRSFDTFQPGRDGRAWFLTIVRNTCRTWLRQNRLQETMPLEEESSAAADRCLDPEAILIEKIDSQAVHQAIEELPFDYREIVILRELEGFSYKEIAQIVDIPLGTVMSRLSRARAELYTRLGDALGGRR
jgi:RNA polymerase sigma-70 factor (ECF subfamily)